MVISNAAINTVLKAALEKFQEEGVYREKVANWGTGVYIDWAFPRFNQNVFVYALGVTGGSDPRAFRVHTWLAREQFDSHGLRFLVAWIVSEMHNLLLTLDTFRDERCTCKPEPGKEYGEHCAFHKEMYGY